MESDNQTQVPSPNRRCSLELACQEAGHFLHVGDACGNEISQSMGCESSSQGYFCGFIEWLRLSFLMAIWRAFLQLTEFVEVFFWDGHIQVLYTSGCLSERFPCTRSLGNFHLHTLWEADFCVRRMEIYLCVHYLRRLFSEYHLHVRCLFSVEHRIFPFVFKTKNQRIPLFCS